MKKQQIKALSRLANQLPETKELVKYSIVKKGWELSFDEIDRAKIDIEADKDYIQRGNYKIADVNHNNRLKKAYARNKEQGIIDYIFWVNQNNQNMNKLFEEMHLKEVSNELMGIAEKGGKGFWNNLLNFLFAFLTVFRKKPQIV